MSRQVVMAGRIGPDGQHLVYLCAWCGEWLHSGSEEAHRNGATISHAQCRRCAAQMLKQHGLDPARA